MLQVSPVGDDLLRRVDFSLDLKLIAKLKCSQIDRNFATKYAIMAVVLLSIGLVAVFFLFMSIRILLVKNGEFRGTCASQSPWLNKEGVTCGYCGRDLSAGEACGKQQIDENQDMPPIRKQQK